MPAFCLAKNAHKKMFLNCPVVEVSLCSGVLLIKVIAASNSELVLYVSKKPVRFTLLRYKPNSKF